MICDAKGATIATAEPERNKYFYVKDEDVPVVWYLTSATVAGQGEMMRKVVADHIFKNAELRIIRIIWIPCAGIPGIMCLPRDILEVADSVQKVKELGMKHRVTVEVSLATSWLPLGKHSHDEALQVLSMNRALLVLGYHWLRCRVTDLLHTTTHEVRGNDKEDTVEIEGLEMHKLVSDMYQDRHSGGMEIGDHVG